MTVTGRIDGGVSAIWHEEVLAPQFAYEAEHLLHHYVSIERVLLLEYVRLGLVDVAGAAMLAARLADVTSASVRADPDENMSDISLALERHVASGPVPPFTAWHVDRSRNDQQACAQLMAAREQVRTLAAELTGFGRAVGRLADAYADLPMPGYTHSQGAQVITPGFYLAALAEETLATVTRLLATYDQIDASPLGSGSMAGQELDWDRERMAVLLGFSRAQPHALVSVASRSWALAVSGDLAVFAVALSRFVTDLMAWGGSAHGFLDLPDELAGISAAMPQKRNFPVLERIRGRACTVSGGAAQLAAAQSSTPYTNTVEVSKEAGKHLRTQIEALHSALRLARAVVDGASFHADRTLEACEQEFLGGFSLANHLTLQNAIPWRQAQIIAGRYVKAAVQKGLTPAAGDGALLAAIAAETGYQVLDPDAALTASFDVTAGLRAKRSAGSTHPDAVRELLAAQEQEFRRLTEEWEARQAAVTIAGERVDYLLDRGRTTPAAAPATAEPS